MSLKYSIHHVYKDNEASAILIYQRHGKTHRIGAPAVVWTSFIYNYARYGIRTSC